MVFVTIGTQKQQFNRIFNILKSSKELKFEKIIVQSGYTYETDDKFQIIKFMNNEEFEKNIENADFVVTHGGVGTIVTALKKSKKVLAIPRLKKYNEHVDDHQIEICKELEKQKYILYLKEEENIDEKINELKRTNFKKYISNNYYIDILRKEI